MKTLRAGGKYSPFDKHYDERDLQKLDVQQGRRYLNADERDGMWYVATASMMASNGMAMLGGFVKYSGERRRLATAITMLHNAVKGLSAHGQSDQMITIVNNVNNVDVFLSSRPVDCYLNIRNQHMQDIVNHALQSCELLCDKTREQSKACPVRRALENVPGMRGAARERAQYCGDSCPYAGLTMEMEGEHASQD